MLRHPPVSEAFLRKIGNAEFLKWLDHGVFTVLRKKPTTTATATQGAFFEKCLRSLPTDTGDYPTITVDEGADLVEPDDVTNATEGVHCLHGALARQSTVMRDTPNRGRAFFTCPLQADRCGFFRWKEDLQNGNFSDVHVSAGDPSPVCYTLSQLQQVAAWYTTAQGSPEWLKLRFGRITASNFGSITGTNRYASPNDYLRSLLWNTRMDGKAMRWGSINEHVASKLFQQFLAREVGDDQVLVEDRGIWIPSDLPYVGGSPDGIVYQVESVVEANSDYEVLQCSRCLLEIKTPWKVRDRKPGEPFYPHIEVPQGSGRWGACPEYYMDQVNGNCGLMGLKAAYFVVLTRAGFQVTYIPFAEDYWGSLLRPKLERFYTDSVRPSQALRQSGKLAIGMVSATGTGKRLHMQQ